MKIRPYKSYRLSSYVKYLERLERECPDIMSILENEIYECSDRQGGERQAREYAIELLGQWIANLAEVRNRLKDGV